jgi:hypothetical protein
LINSTSSDDSMVYALCIFFLIVSVVFVIEVIISLRSGRVLRKLAVSNRNVDANTKEYDAIKNIIASYYGVYDRLKDIKGRAIEINNCVDYLKSENLSGQIIIKLAEENAELKGVIEDLQTQLSEDTIKKEKHQESS